jgi:hypothetical protein
MSAVVMVKSQRWVLENPIVLLHAHALLDPILQDSTEIETVHL